MSGMQFPEAAFMRAIACQNSILSLLRMMEGAYRTFESSAESDSAHWAIVRAIADDCEDFADIVFALVDLYLLHVSRATVVPVPHLVRLRVAQLSIQERMMEHFCTALNEQIKGGSEERASSVASDHTRMEEDARGGATTHSRTKEAKELVLSSQDIHSVEALVFGICGISAQMGKLQKALLEMHHEDVGNRL